MDLKKISKITSYGKEEIKISKDFFNEATRVLKKADETKDLQIFYQAISLYQESLAKYPKNIEAYQALAFIAWRMNEHEKALLLLKKAREYDSFNINLSKQMQAIKDDYTAKEKAKLIKKHSNKAIEETSDSNKNIISEGVNTFKSILGISSSEKEPIKQEKTKSIVSNGNSTKSMFEALGEIQAQKGHVKIKASSFISKLIAV
ncbi:MAG: hypothetical protein U0457_17175 [Candidatus Sericytochromatia bacterium]